MSSITVREAVYADWSRLTPGLRFVATINRSLPRNPPLPLPDVWGTLEFEVTSRNHVTMGSNPWIEERGIVTFGVFARSGHGDLPGVKEATDLMRAWEGWSDPSGNCWFASVSAPVPLEEQADGNWFLIGVTAEYRAQERVALP